MSQRKISRNISKVSEDTVKYPTKLHQDFDLGDSLGHGGFGQIFKAKHKCDNNEYAIKIIKFDSNMEDAGKYRREANNLSKLSHNHIVRYYNSWIDTARIPLSEYKAMMQSESGNSLSAEIDKLSENGYMNSLTDYDDFEEEEDITDEDSDSLVSFKSDDEVSKEVQYLFIQMELCEKRTLRTAIDDNLYLEEAKLNKYFREVCEGLSHIHQNGIVHRDLKPENIFLTSGDVIKIGDFGLSKKIAWVNELENLTIDEDQPCTSSTEICGTRIYIGPEFFDGGNFFNTKADIYSLGVTYFEMCSRPMTTMEKNEQFPITAEKFKNIQFSKNNTKKKILIKNMLHSNYNQRPTCEHILKILNSEKSLGEIQEIMQQNKKVPYLQLKSFKKILGENSIEKCDLMSSFTKITVEIFELHGGHNIEIPTFLPTFNNYCDNLTTLLNIRGNSVSVSNKSRIAFCNYIETNNLQALRRYSVGKIFEEGNYLPTETHECIFEAITPKPDHVSDAEILYMAKEICNKSGRKDIYFEINHRIIYSTILKDFGIANEDAPLFTNRMVKLSKKIIEWKKFKLALKPELKRLFIEKIWEPCNITIAEKTISSKLKNKYGQLTTVFNELTMIVENMNKFGINSGYIFFAPLLITDKNSSGFMFRVVLMNPPTVIATGERFDSLINKAVKNKKKNPPKSLAAIGISFHVDNMLKLLNSSDTIKRRVIDVAIYVDENNKAEAIPLYMKLLAESIKCQIITEIPKSKSSDKPPIILVHLLAGNASSSFIYTVKKTFISSDMPWDLHVVYSGSWEDEAFLDIIKRQVNIKDQADFRWLKLHNLQLK